MLKPKEPKDHGSETIATSILAEREACARVADNVAAARYKAGDMEGWGTACQVAKFIRERSVK